MSFKWNVIIKDKGGHGKILKRQGGFQDLKKDENLRAWRQEDKGYNMRQAETEPYTEHSVFAEREYTEIIKQ